MGMNTCNNMQKPFNLTDNQQERALIHIKLTAEQVASGIVFHLDKLKVPQFSQYVLLIKANLLIVASGDIDLGQHSLRQ